MVGYSNTGFELCDPASYNVSNVKHVHFIENVTYNDRIGRNGQLGFKQGAMEETQEGLAWLDNTDSDTGCDEVTDKGKRNKENDKVSETDDGESNEEEMDELFLTTETNETGSKINVRDALSGPESHLWRKAMADEYKSIKNSGAIQLVKKEKGQDVIDTKWILCIKKESDGSCKYKARLVIRRFKQNKEYQKYETYAPVASIEH